jgi:CheY-like chemotaxis protein
VSPRGKETILVVEDDSQVREVTVRSLRAGGYRVLAARDAQEAVAVTESGPGHIDLLITDVIMPRGDGPVVAQSLRRRWPDLRTLYISGYAQDAISEHVPAPGVEFLQKPFTASSLLARVRGILDAP